MGQTCMKCSYLNSPWVKITSMSGQSWTHKEISFSRLKNKIKNIYIAINFACVSLNEWKSYQSMYLYLHCKYSHSKYILIVN